MLIRKELRALTRFAGVRRRPATSDGLGRPSTAIGGRIAPSATLLHRWASNQEGFGSDSDSPGALSEGEATLGGRATGDDFSTVVDEPNMEPTISPRTTIVMEKRLWKVR